MRGMERRRGEVCQILGQRQLRVKAIPSQLYTCEDILAFIILLTVVEERFSDTPCIFEILH